MNSTRLLLILAFVLMLAGAGLAQSVPVVVSAATARSAAPARSKRVITNDDIPSVVEPENVQAGKQSRGAAVSQADGPDEEVCEYVGSLRTEQQQLQRRVQKLQASLERADSDLLRTVYTNALLRLTDSLHTKETALEEAESAPQVATCSQKPTQSAKTAEK